VRGRADPADVLLRGPGAEEQPDRGRLDRDLRGAALGQPVRAELAGQLDVLVGDGRGLCRILGSVRVTRTASSAVSPATYRSTMARVCGAVVMSWRSRVLADAASRALRSTG
jgi:hypothetical protein